MQQGAILSPSIGVATIAAAVLAGMAKGVFGLGVPRVVLPLVGVAMPLPAAFAVAAVPLVGGLAIVESAARRWARGRRRASPSTAAPHRLFLLALILLALASIAGAVRRPELTAAAFG